MPDNQAKTNTNEDLTSSTVYKKKEQEWLESGDYQDLYKRVTETVTILQDKTEKSIDAAMAAQAAKAPPVKIEHTACSQYSLFSKAATTLTKMHETYIPRPCISGFYCMFWQNRTIIRAYVKEFKNEGARAKTVCQLTMMDETMRRMGMKS